MLLAIGLPHEIAHGSLRLTLGRDTTLEDVDFAVDSLKAMLQNLRMMSPLYEDFQQGKVESVSRALQGRRLPLRELASFTASPSAEERHPHGYELLRQSDGALHQPQNVGEIENASGCGTVGNAVCGDIMRVYLDIDENNVIQDAKFKTFGCGAAIATSSMATVLVKGKTVQEALKVTNKAVMEALDGLPPVKVHCSLLAEEAIHAALWDYAEKNGIVIEGLEKPVSDISEHDHGHDDEDDE